MSIRFTCANVECGREVAAPDGSEGKKARCPHCGEVQTIPAITAEGSSIFDADIAPARKRRHRDKAAAPARPVAGERPVQSCPVCATVYPAGEACPRCRQHRTSYAHEKRDVARFVKIGLMLGVLVAVVVAIAWAIHAYKPPKNGGGGGLPNYLDGVFGAKHMAESVSSMHNIGLIRDGLEKYRSAHGEYPPYLKDLVDNAMVPAGALYAPDRESQAYKYIRGQNPKMRGDNILVYEEKPIHRDKCNVLRLNGQIETLTPEQLKEAVEQTRLRVGED